MASGRDGIVIKCTNCDTLNDDGTLLCENCAWDLMDAPPFEVPAAAAPMALSGSFDVMPFQGDPGSQAPVLSTLRPPTAAQAPMAEFVQPDQMPAGSPPMASPVTVLQPYARQTNLMPPEALPTTGVHPPTGMQPPAALPMTGMQPPAALPMTGIRPPTSLPPRGVSALQRPQPEPPARGPAPRVSSLAPGDRPRLVIVKGMKTNVEYPIYDGENVIGRADDLPVEIDLRDLEKFEKTYTSRQHACVIWEDGAMFVKDLNSANGTFLNKERLDPEVKRPLRNGDYIQTGGVLFQVRT